MDDVTFEELFDNLIVVQCSWVSFMIAKGEKLAVIDTAIPEFMPKAVISGLQHLNARLEDVDFVINTHGHWDHVLGNSSIVEASSAEVWIPADEMEKLSTPADRFLVDGEMIDLGNSMTFEVITLPGHSIGMSCLYNKERQLLIASDATQAYAIGIPLIFHSPKQYRDSIKKLLTFDIETIVLGHEFAWSGPAKFFHQGKDEVNRYLQECFEASMKVSDVIREVVKDQAERSYEYILQTTLHRLREDTSYGFAHDLQPETLGWGHGTILSELREIGTVNSIAS